MVSSLTWWSKWHLEGTGYTTHWSKALWDQWKALNISAIHLCELEHIYIYICMCVCNSSLDCMLRPFTAVYVRMFLCCHDNFSLRRIEQYTSISCFSLQDKSHSDIYIVSLALLRTDFSCILIPKTQAAECWWMLMVAQAYTTGLAYRHSLDDPSGWRVKVRVAVTNTAVTSPPSTLLANWPSKTLSTKHGQLGEYRGQGQQNMPITQTGLAFALHAVTQDAAKTHIRAVFLQRQCNYDKGNRQWKNIMTSISSGF